eukprot:363864-Chlamydomonas_euryale.AAC.12
MHVDDCDTASANVCESTMSPPKPTATRIQPECKLADDSEITLTYLEASGPRQVGIATKLRSTRHAEAVPNDAKQRARFPDL